MVDTGSRFSVLRRRVAGAEIVERDADTEVAQVAQRGDHVVLVLVGDRLAHLELELAGGDRVGLEQIRHHRLEAAVAQLRGEQVDADAQRRPSLGTPAHDLPAGPVEAPPARVQRQRAVVHRRYEGGGREQASRRVAPPHQRLRADDRACRERDLRLVEQLELVGIERVADLVAQHPARGARRLHSNARTAGSFGLARLGRLQREVGGSDEVLGRRGVIGRHRRTDRRADHQCVAVDLERLGQRHLDVAGAFAGPDRIAFAAA